MWEKFNVPGGIIARKNFLIATVPQYQQDIWKVSSSHLQEAKLWDSQLSKRNPFAAMICLSLIKLKKIRSCTFMTHKINTVQAMSHLIFIKLQSTKYKNRNHFQRSWSMQQEKVRPSFLRLKRSKSKHPHESWSKDQPHQRPLQYKGKSQ